MKIKKIIAREIYNSRGFPTIQCEIVLEDGHSVYASVPAGISIGVNEAKKIYDGQDRLFGRGVLEAVECIEKIIGPEFIDSEPHAVNADLKMIELDGTDDKSNLGANALLAVSMAMYRAHAYVEQVELYEFIGYVCSAETVALPFPFFNVINGGKHAQNNIKIQEFMIVPVGGTSFRASMEIAATIFYVLENALKKHGKKIIFGDEGGYASDFSDEKEVFSIITKALEEVKNSYGYNALIGIDVAASEFYNHETKKYNFNNREMDANDLISYYEELIQEFPICSIEDGLFYDDWQGWTEMMLRLKDKVQIIGDDIFATNPQLIGKGLEHNVATGSIIKPDQIGTVTEALQTIRMCKDNNLTTMVSHRSGDTEDTFIVDLAVGASAGQIKSGGLSRSERVAKYNRLLLIEDHLSDQ